MPPYLLRDVDDATRQRFTARAARDGHSLRWVLLRLVEEYAAGADDDSEDEPMFGSNIRSAIRAWRGPAERLAKGKR